MSGSFGRHANPAITTLRYEARCGMCDRVMYAGPLDLDQSVAIAGLTFVGWQIEDATILCPACHGKPGWLPLRMAP